MRRERAAHIWSGGWVPGDIVMTGGLALASGCGVITTDDLLIKIPLALISIPVLVLTLVMVAGLEPGHRPARVVRSWLARAGGSGLVGVVVVAIVGVLDVRRSPVSAAVLLVISIPPLLVEARSRWGGPAGRHP